MMKKILLKNKVEVLQFDKVFVDCNISHFVTTRHGGVSKGTYSSMNLGLHSGDDISLVMENRQILASALSIPVENMIIPHQTHQDNILIVDNDFMNLSSEEKENELSSKDAVITPLRGIYVIVSTADCVPILIYDKKNNIAAAVHAGWRGTQKQIVRSVIETMKSIYSSHPEDLMVGIGPSISAKHFEVGEEVVEAFQEAKFPMEKIMYIDTVSSKAHIDLWESNRWQLIEEGVNPANIEIAGLCTFTDENDFYSARRLGIKCGRMMTGIMIK